MSWEGESRKPGERPRRRPGEARRPGERPQRREVARERPGVFRKANPANTFILDFHFPQIYLSHPVVGICYFTLRKLK